MALTSARQVTSGFFRVHLWMLLGFFTLISLAVAWRKTVWTHGDLLLGLAIAAAVVSYVGSVIWIYEARRAGKATLWLLTAIAFAAALLAQWPTGDGMTQAMAALDIATGG